MIGSAYNNTVLTLTGMGFSPNANENNVTINGVECVVMTFNETSISCSVGESSAGVHNVSLLVEGKGIAAHTNGGWQLGTRPASHSNVIAIHLVPLPGREPLLPGPGHQAA